MSLPLFIARKIYGQHDQQKAVSMPAVRIATIGVAVGLAVMIVTVAVVMGFKSTISSKLAGFGSHVQVQNIRSSSSFDSYPICIDDSLLSVLSSISGVKSASRYTLAQGILKTDADFLGVALKGIGPEYDLSYMKECLVEGEMPVFSDTATTYPLVISKNMADKLQLKTGDRIFAYFIGQDDVRTRRFTVKAIYQTNMKRFDDRFCLTDIYATRRLNGWQNDECSGAEIASGHFDQLDELTLSVQAAVGHTTDREGNALTTLNIRELYPQVFSWLELLDINVWIILALMVAVAGFTMISGLLIIILERTQMIGVLKALGATDSTVRHTFLWLAAFIVGRGLLWGNIVGVGLVVLQMATGIIRLDPQTYYVSEAPVTLSLPVVLLLNAATLAICMLMLVGPSYLVSRIHPARSMRYE